MNDLPSRKASDRPSKCPGRPRVLKYRITWLAIFSLIGNCKATTIVTLVSTHGIVICADGKSTDTASGQKPGIPVSHTSTKVFVIQNRFVLSHGGIRDFHIWKGNGKKRVPIPFPYSLDRIVGDLRGETSPMFTLAGIADLIRSKLVAQFAGFDVFPRSGSLRPEDLPPPHDIITLFSIAGYDGDTAHVYEVGVDMDWKALAHRIPPTRMLYPEKRKNLSLFLVGHGEAIMDLYFKPDAQAARQFAATFPLEYTALIRDLDLDISRMITLARGLLAIDIARNPNDVGYPLTVVAVPKGGRITTQAYGH